MNAFLSCILSGKEILDIAISVTKKKKTKT